MHSQYLAPIALAFATFTTSAARADILPPHHGGRVYRCTQVDANKDGTGPKQGQVDDFLHTRGYSSVSVPSVIKLDNGQYQVCATFTR